MNALSNAVLHVVGNACIDITWTVPRFPLVGETLVAGSTEEDLGGKGLNQAVAAARAGASVRLWAAVGRDEPAERIRGRLAREGVSADTLTALDLPTDRSMILVDGNGDNMIVSRTDCAAAFDPIAGGGLAAALRPGDYVVMQGNLSPELTEAVLALARRSGAVTVLNPSPIATVAAMPWPLVDWAVLNHGEATALTEKAGLRPAGHRLLAMGVGAVVVTSGADGALLMDDGGALDVAAPAMAVVNTAGAGDVVCGVFAGLVARGFPSRSAIRIAIAAASLSVSRPGTLSACPSRAEIADITARILLEG